MTQVTLTEQVNNVTQALSQDIKNNKLELPSPPKLLLALRKIANDPNASALDIANVIKHDINISGRLIKIANCALFTSRNKVSTVQAATLRLGLKKVQSLVTGLVLSQQIMRHKTKGLEASCQQIWQTSNDVSVLSYTLAQKKTKLDPEQALLAGIIHNIGALPLVLKLNTIQALKEDPKVMAQVADIVIPKLYARAGHLILHSWHFAPEIIAVAKEHLNLTRDDNTEIELTDVALVAHQLNQLSELSEDVMPEQLTASNTFKKFWPDWTTAVSELSEWQEDMKQMKSEMSA